jgi:hypothetical protein
LTLTISFVTMYLYMFIRVTRLDEFSPNGWLFSSSFLKTAKVCSPHSWTTFFHS